MSCSMNSTLAVFNLCLCRKSQISMHVLFPATLPAAAYNHNPSVQVWVEQSLHHLLSPTTVSCAVTVQLYLWLVCSCEHGHLNILSSDWFGLARGRRSGGLLVVAAHTDKEEEQGYGQRDRHTGNQDVQDLHVAAARLVFIVCRDGRRERNNIRYVGYRMTGQYNVIKRHTTAETISRLIY